MIKTLALLSLNLGIALGFNHHAPLRVNSDPTANIQAKQNTPSTPNNPNSATPALDESPLGFDEQLWGRTGDKAALIKSLDHSLRYIETPLLPKPIKIMWFKVSVEIACGVLW